MKYVRVKDMSWEWITTFADYDNARNKATELGLTYSPKIVKQADTLEELFDTCICVDKDEKFRHYHLTNFLDRCQLNLEDYDWFGAIWKIGRRGEPTLIPVAKMNEKERFELL